MRKCWCARCGRSFTIPPDLAESRIKCGTCGYIQEIPEPGDYPIDDPIPEPEMGTYSLTRDPVSSPVPPSGSPSTRTGEAGRWSRLLQSYAIEHSRLQGFSVCLLCLSAADLMMTFTLLRTSHTFYESNPIAQWIFHRWNMAGLVLFKFSMIALAIALGEVIERHRPRWGKAVLLVGCIAAAYAFTQGLRLYLGHGAGPPGEEG
jgi:ribosomal protein S27AE